LRLPGAFWGGSVTARGRGVALNERRPPVTLDQATDILRHKRGSLHDFAAAGAFVASYYSHEGKHLLRPMKEAIAVNDSAPSRGITQDPVRRREAFALLDAAMKIDTSMKPRKPNLTLVKDTRTQDEVIKDAVSNDARWCAAKLAQWNAYNKARWNR
jgi:hypothetical protein